MQSDARICGGRALYNEKTHTGEITSVFDGCKMLVTLQGAEPQMDNEGIYFICPGCKRHNQLRAPASLARGDEPLELEHVHRPRPKL